MNKQVIKTLRQLAREKRSGVLTCDGAKVTRRMFFLEGAVVAARSSDERERLGEVLVRRGRISEQQFQDASVFAKKGKKLGEILVELRIVEANEIEDFVGEQVLEVCSRVLFQPPRRMAFHKTDEIARALKQPVPVLDIIMEAARRTPSIESHLKKFMEDDRALSLTKDSMFLMDSMNLKPHEAFILSRITGNEPTRSVFALSPLSEEQTARAVLGHLAVGILELTETASEHGLALKG